jgi:EmrB/QacA subfamily drug resistance transporter
VTRQQRLLLAVAVMASFVALLDGSVVNVALPAITRDLGGGLRTQQWTVDSYLVGLGALILIAGSLSDLFGRKRILAIGLVGFLVASILCAVAPTAGFLIASRALQGVAGALLVPSSLALIMSGFRGAEQSRAIGQWTAWTGIAFVIGPLVGGSLVDSVSWRAVFWLNVLPIVATLLLLRAVPLPDDVVPHARVDYVGAFLGTIGLGATVYGFIEAPGSGWGKPSVLLPLVVGIALLAAFLAYERRAPHPMLPYELFRVRNFSVGNIATVFIYGGLSVVILLNVLFLQQVAHYSAFRAGTTVLPQTLVMFLLSSRFGDLAGKYGPRLFMGLGPIVAACGVLLFLRVDERAAYWTQVVPGVFVFGLGMSMTVAPLTSAVLGDIDSKHAGVGSAVNNAVARIAGLLAVASIGVLIGDGALQGPTAAAVHAYHKGIVDMAVLVALGGVISLLGIRNPRPVHTVATGADNCQAIRDEAPGVEAERV